MTRRSTVLLACTSALAVLLAGGAALALTTGEDAVAAPVAVEVAVPVLSATSLSADGTQPWTDPLEVTAADGELLAVTAISTDDEELDGRLADGVWRSSGGLVPSSTYRITGTVRDAAGDERKRPLVVRTSAPTQVVTAGLSPGDDAVVGVGQPVVVRLDAPVRDAAARDALEERLSVRSDPAVRGAWRWVHDREVHWRPAEFWPSGTDVEVRVDLERLALPDGTWGSGVRTSRFEIGDEVVSTVDVSAHTMTVRRGGEVLRTMKASMGTPENPTRGGTFLVLEKYASKVLDSDTVGLPGEYETEVDSAVRLSYSGTFTHAAPWSVKDQGVRNVSHGCVNLSPEDARWFYELAKRGDVVQVVGTDVPPLPDDPGSVDWNMTFEQWSRG